LPNRHVHFIALPNFPLVAPNDDLALLIQNCLHQAAFVPQNGDIFVVCSKIVSKAENRFVDLRTVAPSPRALELAARTRKDPRLVELVLQNSQNISRVAPHVLLVRHHLGFTSANAGIDASNVGENMREFVLLLPRDPDASAQHLRKALQAAYGVEIGVIISDTHGRPFRLGNLGVAIGVAGVPALLDQRGEVDLFGRELQATLTPLADEIAAAAGLVTGQAAEGQPVVLVRGVAWQDSQDGARALVRPPEQDLYA
jgi:coenzyme F420-0:L-glutamate ligase/coenzyme F420-1:gamma-L-glutamate ligase